jgi:hypothetical protein
MRQKDEAHAGATCDRGKVAPKGASRIEPLLEEVKEKGRATSKSPGAQPQAENTRRLKPPDRIPAPFRVLSFSARPLMVGRTEDKKGR